MDFRNYDFSQNVTLQSSMLESEQRFLAISLIDDLQSNKHAQKNYRLFNHVLYYIIHKALAGHLTKEHTIRNLLDEILELSKKQDKEAIKGI